MCMGGVIKTFLWIMENRGNSAPSVAKSLVWYFFNLSVLFQDCKLRQEIRDNGFRDGVTGNLSLTVDGLSYKNVHQPKIQKMRDIAESVITT